MAPASVELSYPGVWLRDDVWATHGHYLDVHATLPTFERLAAGVMSRLVGAVPQPRATPDDYERVLAPVYAWIDAAAERAAPGRAAAGSGSAVQAYRLLSGGGRRPMAARAVAGLFPLAILGINRLGLGPVSADLRGPELRRSALRGMGEAVMRLGVTARARDLRPLAPRRPAARRRRRRVARPRRPAAAQRRLLDVRDALPRRPRPARQPLLAGRAHRRRRRRARRGSSACSRPCRRRQTCAAPIRVASCEPACRRSTDSRCRSSRPAWRSSRGLRWRPPYPPPVAWARSGRARCRRSCWRPRSPPCVRSPTGRSR